MHEESIHHRTAKKLSKADSGVFDSDIFSYAHQSRKNEKYGGQSHETMIIVVLHGSIWLELRNLISQAVNFGGNIMRSTLMAISINQIPSKVFKLPRQHHHTYPAQTCITMYQKEHFELPRLPVQMSRGSIHSAA